MNSYKLYFLFLFVFLTGSSSFCQDSLETEENLLVPFIYSSFNGGIVPSKTHNFHFQNIFILCNTFLYQYEEKIELGWSLYAESNYAFWLRYHQKVGQFVKVSPSLIMLPTTRFYLSPFEFENSGKLYPGIQVSADLKGFRSLASMHYINNDFTDEVRESTLLFSNEEILGNLYSVQLGYRNQKENILFNMEYYIFKSRDRNKDFDTIQQKNLVLSASFQLSKRISFDVSYWTRLNNKEPPCDDGCINGTPRIGISMAF